MTWSPWIPEWYKRAVRFAHAENGTYRDEPLRVTGTEGDMIAIMRDVAATSDERPDDVVALVVKSGYDLRWSHGEEGIPCSIHWRPEGAWPPPRPLTGRDLRIGTLILERYEPVGHRFNFHYDDVSVSTQEVEVQVRPTPRSAVLRRAAAAGRDSEWARAQEGVCAWLREAGAPEALLASERDRLREWHRDKAERAIARLRSAERAGDAP